MKLDKSKKKKKKSMETWSIREIAVTTKPSQSSKQVKKSSNREDLTNISPEASESQ